MTNELAKKILDMLARKAGFECFKYSTSIDKKPRLLNACVIDKDEHVFFIWIDDYNANSFQWRKYVDISEGGNAYARFLLEMLRQSKQGFAIVVYDDECKKFMHAKTSLPELLVEFDLECCSTLQDA